MSRILVPEHFLSCRCDNNFHFPLGYPCASIQATLAPGIPTDVVNLGPADWILDWASLVNEEYTPEQGVGR